MRLFLDKLSCIRTVTLDPGIWQWSQLGFTCYTIETWIHVSNAVWAGWPLQSYKRNYLP